jgi:hypothetical protein
MHFEGCDIGTATVEQGHFDKCGFTGTLTMKTADDYEFHGCYDKTATAAIFTKEAGVNITAEWVDWSGSITLSGIQASSTYIIAGTEIGDIILNGDAAGTVEIRGIYKTITDNRGGGTLTITGAIKAGDVATILADTNELQGDDVPGLIAALNDVSTAEVKTQAVAALNTDNYSEPGQGAPPATTTLATKIGYTYKNLRNKKTETATQFSLYNDDTTTIDQKAVVSDDSTTTTKGEFISGA